MARETSGRIDLKNIFLQMQQKDGVKCEQTGDLKDRGEKKSQRTSYLRKQIILSKYDYVEKKKRRMKNIVRGKEILNTQMKYKKDMSI